MNLFSSIRNMWSALGVMLFLIALYLVLERAQGASSLIRAGGGTLGNIFLILQGRRTN